jgi:hypothetical protein
MTMTMTVPSTSYRMADAAPRRGGPQVARDRAGELLGRRCIRCGAVGTHYLTCPSLKLPPGYRLSAERRPECLCGRPAGTCETCP